MPVRESLVTQVALYTMKRTIFIIIVLSTLASGIGASHGIVTQASEATRL